MLHLLLILFHLAQLVQGTSTNTTDSSCRNVWSILSSCALTLLICVWHAIHFTIHQDEWTTTWWFKGLCVLGSFVAPEAIVVWAARDWKSARERVIEFRDEEYEWSMTHSFFAEMGGFVYRDDKGRPRTIDSREFLRPCKANEIANPIITAKDIKGRSKSDALGKVILTLQLFWFMLQVVVRGSTGFAVTLVELDTVCMAVLSLLVLLLCTGGKSHSSRTVPTFCTIHLLEWNCIHERNRSCKPFLLQHSASRTDITIYRSNAWKSDPSCLSTLMSCFTRTQKTQPTTGDEETSLADRKGKPSHPKSRRLVDELDEEEVIAVSLLSTWTILIFSFPARGIVHLERGIEFATTPNSRQSLIESSGTYM
ncbi:hypothetical protein JVT61DRAFT_4047 [Boletus reticuloceps]|uniref:Uncharacterized protein n=1 Tax=Boletus reticuloceps TaxID=495285 RepID=A0A8I3A7H7_9AGAM|nr:hypothetical protein JVT61DRAFT_4047 [Boletus reticuloceps]